MPGIQLPIGIDMVNAVPADFKYGPYPNTATAIAAIPLALRFDGLTVQITGTGEYHWLAADLSNAGLIPKTGGGGTSFPIVRYVYLVQDPSDAILMGGAPGNAYTTFQAAYAAANVLQVTLGGNNIVELRVGNTTAATVGNIILTANWNPYVQIIGEGADTSNVGSINLDNAVGSGFSFGTAVNPVVMSGIRTTVNGISCNAIGPSGNGGEISILTRGCNIGRINSRPTVNIAGSSGNLRIIDGYGTTQITSISNNLSFPGSTGTTGSLFLKAFSRMFVGGIENLGTDEFNTNTAGAVYIENIDANTLNKNSTSTIIIKNSTFGFINTAFSSGTGNITITDTKVQEFVNLGSNTNRNLFLRNVRIGEDQAFNSLGTTSINNIAGFNQVELWNCYLNNSYSITDPTQSSHFMNNNAEIIIRDSVLENIDSPTSQTGTALFVLNVDGLTGTCKILNSSIMGAVGGIFASAPTTVNTFSTYIEQPNDVNITILPL